MTIGLLENTEIEIEYNGRESIASLSTKMNNELCIVVPVLHFSLHASQNSHSFLTASYYLTIVSFALVFTLFRHGVFFSQVISFYVLELFSFLSLFFPTLFFRSFSFSSCCRPLDARKYTNNKETNKLSFHEKNRMRGRKEGEEEEEGKTKRRKWVEREGNKSVLGVLSSAQINLAQ